MEWISLEVFLVIQVEFVGGRSMCLMTQCEPNFFGGPNLTIIEFRWAKNHNFLDIHPNLIL